MLRLSKKRYPAGPQGYYDPTLMMRAPPKATSFLLEHVPEQEGGSSRLPQRCSAPSHHTELPQPTAVTLPKASRPPVVCPLPWPFVLAPVCVIAQPLSRRRQWASTKWAPETLQRRLAGALIPHQPWLRAAPAPPQPLAPGYATLHAALMHVSSSRPPALNLSRPPTQSYPFPWP